MKIVGIVAKDWAYAAWHIFQALKRYDINARLIYLKPRDKALREYESKYDIRYWTPEDKKEAEKVISEADIYHICESGETINHLNKLNLKDRPRLMAVNSSTYYHYPKMFQKLKPYADMFVALTINYPQEELRLGLQPIDETKIPVRLDYGLRSPKKGLMAGGAPARQKQYNNKGFRLLKQKLGNKLDLIMDTPYNKVLGLMEDRYDIFTHGLYYAYGYTLIEAAMIGIPCFGYIGDRDKHLVSIDGKYPVLDAGMGGEHLDRIFELMGSEDERKKLGQLMRRWALKYHSYEACFQTYKKFYEELLENK